MLSYLPVDEIGSHVFECCESAGLVHAHQPAISNHVGGEDSSEATFHFVNKQSFRATVEESRYAIFKLTRRESLDFARDDGVCRSPLHNRAGPSQSATEYHHQYIIAGFYPAGAVRFIERDRHRCR